MREIGFIRRRVVAINQERLVAVEVRWRIVGKAMFNQIDEDGVEASRLAIAKIKVGMLT